MIAGWRLSARSFFSNLAVPMPIGRKARLLLRNNWTKLSKGQTCCGHPGEPGC